MFLRVTFRSRLPFRLDHSPHVLLSFRRFVGQPKAEQNNGLQSHLECGDVFPSSRALFNVSNIGLRTCTVSYSAHVPCVSPQVPLLIDSPGAYRSTLCMISKMDADAVTRPHPPLWFPDGNLILVTQPHGTRFKVHRGILERHSEVFRDLFALARPDMNDAGEPEGEEGCVRVEVYDRPGDMGFLLRALYDGLYFTPPTPLPFPSLSAILRLSTKYLIPHLRARSLLRLALDFPSTLAGWDRREHLATDSKGRYVPRECFVHPVWVIRLAREVVGMEGVLGAACYDLARYGPRRIVAGVEREQEDEYQEDEGEEICAGAEGGPGMVRLSRNEIRLILMGRETAQRYLASFISLSLSRRPPAPTCSFTPASSTLIPPAPHPCIESFYFIHLNLLRAISGIACGRDADPLFTLTQAVEMLDRKDFSDGERVRGLGVCEGCKAEFRECVRRAREDVWRLIPGWFGLVDVGVDAKAVVGELDTGMNEMEVEINTV